MSVIKINNFGGEMPSVSPRALPDSAAQVNSNLLLGVNEFRPVAEDKAETLPPGMVLPVNAKTLYRITPTDPWRVDKEETSPVRGQVNGDVAGRTYFTRDSSDEEAPRAIDLLRQNRQLGVPAPTVKPAVTVVVGDELSKEELPDAASKSADLIAEVIEKHIKSFMTGNNITFTAPTTNTYGWIPHETDATNSYILAPVTEVATVSASGAPEYLIQPGLEFLKAPSLGGSKVTYQGAAYWRVEVNTAATAYTVDAAALKTALMAIDDPYIPDAKLLDETSATFIAGETAQYFSLANPELEPLVKAATEKTALIDRVLKAAASGASSATLTSSNQYQTQLDQLIGSDATGTHGLVTRAIMDWVYIIVGTSFYGDQLRQVNNVLMDNGLTRGTPRQWWKPSGNGYTFTREEGEQRIRAAIVSCLPPPENGALPTLDYDQLFGIVLGEFQHISGRRPTQADRDYYLGLIDEKIKTILAPLQRFFAFDNLSMLAVGLTGGEDTASAFRKVLDEADAALKALESAYTIRRPLSRQIAVNAYEHSSVSAKAKHLENAVVRLVETRFYFYTYVTDWGEESSPSAPSDMVELDQNDHTEVVIAAPPTNPDRHIKRWRLYRANRGSESTSFQLVDTVDLPALKYEDKKAAEELGEVCPTVTWDEPPKGLKGLVGMPNGIMAGFVGNTVHFCEPYVPYAWPVSYRVTVEHDVVGLGVFGQTLFVGTKGSPYFISGADSASMSAQKLESQQSCSSRRSIVPVQGGVLFASPDGLCVADSSGIQVASAGLFTREEWQKLDPASMFAAQHENIYYLWHGGANPGCLTFDLASKKLGRIDLTATAAFNDKLTDMLYVVSGTQILAVYGNTTRRMGKWKSKLVTMPQQVGLAWIKVYGEQRRENLVTGAPAVPVKVRVYGDGELIKPSPTSPLDYTAIFYDRSPQRLPYGKWLEFEVEVESKARVTSVVLASSTQELQSV